MALRLKTDWILFTTVILLVFFGAVMIYSASSVKAQQQLGSDSYYVERQIFWMAIGLFAMLILKRSSYRKLQHPGVAFAAMGLILMLLIVVFFADSAHHRWLRIGGLQLQPSEFAKPAVMVFLAYFIAMRARAINNRYTLLPALVAVGIVTFFVAVGDFGTAAVIFASSALIFIVAGLDRRFITITLVLGVLAGIALIVQKPYRLKRVVQFVDPEYHLVNRFDTQGRLKRYLNSSVAATDTQYQVEQSKIAVGSGGLTGFGLMHGIQKLLYLPEAHTDMIYAVVGEEFGFFGTAAVLIAFLVIFWRGIRAAVLVPDEFGRYLALGITFVLAIQALMNMSVVLGMGPTKGIPLPMISYGGTSLVSTLVCIGMLLNISEHAG